MALFSIGKKKNDVTAPSFSIPPDNPEDNSQPAYGNGQQFSDPQGYNPYPNFEAPQQNQRSGFSEQPSFDPAPQQYPSQQYSQPSVQPQTSERIEEIAEAIIDEKWNEFTKDVTKIIEWKERTESRLARIEQDLKQLKESFDTLHKSVLGKISDYDRNITEVSTGINAMERVFQKVLPTLTDNVNKLSRITDSMGKKK